MTKSKTIVKLTTEYYHDNKSAFIKKKLTTLKRKSTWYNLLIEECENIDTQEVLSNIINLYNVKDGIYELIICNHSCDYETRVLKMCDYKLIEYIEG